MELLFASKRNLIQFICFWAWLCFVLLGSSLTESQSTLTWQTQPSPQTVDVGSSVSFTCLAQYSKKIQSYEWEHNNLTLPTDSRYTTKDEGRTLQISQTKLEDRGDYRCVAIRRDKVIGKSQNAALNVKGICNSVQLSIKPSGTTFLTGTDLQLRCKCYVYPLGTYTWTKDSGPVTQDGRVTVSRNKLLINNATEGDSGKYECKATTKDGSTTKKSSSTPLSVTVVVGKHPQFLVSPPPSVVVLEGSQKLIPCKAIGSPTPDINWYSGDNRTPLQDGSKYTIHENGSLVIRNINKQDALKYKCTASNLVAEIAAETMVKIAYLDDVVLDKTKRYVLLNHETEVYCKKPPGEPKPSITWQKADNQPLPKKFAVEGCCTLKKNRTKLADSGNYTCIAKNMFGTKSRTIEIIVSEQPVITVKPQDQELKEDEKAMLNCKADSKPPSKISWLKDDSPVKEDARVFVLSNGSLVITKLRPKDSGVYRCSADHDGGWSDSAEAKLTVMAKVKLAGIHNNQVNANLHKPQKIRCDFEGHEPITVTWKKGDGSAPLDKPRVKQDNTILFFEHVEKEDEGHYCCRGENLFSSAESYVNISVFVYPTFDLRPKNTTAYVDDHLWLHCNASGDPKPKISWSKEEQDGDKLDKERFIQHSNGTLHIKNVRLEDQGRYYCIAANHAEMKQSKFSLVVQNHPHTTTGKSVGSMGRTIGIAVGCAAAYIVLVVGLMIYCKGRRARQNKKEEVMPPECENLNANGDIEHRDGEGNDMTMNPIYRSQPSYDKMEFPRHDLEALRSLGNGAYGRAFLARASGIRDGEKETMVVVKALVSNDDQGDLKQFLLSCYDNGRSTMNSNQKLAICGQVASGMNYLASQNFTHKDLAARNCMVGKDLKVKIGYLSLSYDLYNAEYYRFNNMQIPLRWMPPEAIFDDDYSEKSDVWAYGVLVWEIYTLGQLPYHDRSNEEVLKCVKDDLRLAQAR
ncbi:hypothetical protein ACROYT_G039413 [Oculina patagonica]